MDPEYQRAKRLVAKALALGIKPVIEGHIVLWPAELPNVLWLQMMHVRGSVLARAAQELMEE